MGPPPVVTNQSQSSSTSLLCSLLLPFIHSSFTVFIVNPESVHSHSFQAPISFHFFQCYLLHACIIWYRSPLPPPPAPLPLSTSHSIGTHSLPPSQAVPSPMCNTACCHPSLPSLFALKYPLPTCYRPYIIATLPHCHLYAFTICPAERPHPSPISLKHYPLCHPFPIF